MKNPNPNHMLFRFLFTCLFFFTAVSLYSQEAGSCAEKLKTAQSLFGKGQVELIPSLLKDCLKTGFKKEEELTAYKLLIQTYLLNDKIEQADSTMFEFLKSNPEYQLSPTDHSSFVYLFNNFKVKPVVQIGIHAGINVPFLSFVKPNLTGGESKLSDSKFSSNIGNLFFSAESKFKVTEKLEVGFEVGFSQMKFTNKINDNSEHALINYTESQQRIQLPVFAQYDFKSFPKFIIYGRAGFGGAYTLGVTATATYSPTDPTNKNSRTGESLNRKDSRIALDLFGQIAAGVKYKIPKGFLFAELRSDFGMLEQNLSGGLTIPQGDWYYAWRDPNFRLNAFNINIGYTYIFYKPSKRKE
jgi:hypothetical protein